MKLELLSIKEAGKLLGVSRQRIDQFIQAGRLNCIWIGKTRAIFLDELKRFQQNREV